MWRGGSVASISAYSPGVGGFEPHLGTPHTVLEQNGLHTLLNEFKLNPWIGLRNMDNEVRINMTAYDAEKDNVVNTDVGLWASNKYLKI